MNTQIYEEATDWLIQHREAGLSPPQKQEFDTWLRESPQHVRAYLEMSALWEDVPALDSSWNPTSEELIVRARNEGNIYPLADATRNAARSSDPRQPVSASNQRKSRDGSPRFRVRFFTSAAAFMVAMVGVTSWYWLNRSTYATGVGEQRSMTLPDGSSIELNSRSRVRIRYTDLRRDVDLLEGQALFRVAHNTSRPFVVHSGAANVRAVGTQFDVYKKRAGTVVTVVEGKVSVLAGSGPSTPLETPTLTPHATSNVGGSNAILIAAGEQLTVPATEPLRDGNSSVADSPQPANVAAATAWTHRTLVFEATPLTDVVEEFNRYNTRQLVIMDHQLAGIRISGMFSSVNPALLLKFLRTQPELDVVETDTEIRISKR